MIKYRKVKCKSILTKSRLPGVDYVINPYTGCSIGCVYCYARFMKRITKHKEPWGMFVDVKVNAVEVLEKQIQHAKKNPVLLSSVTDPYLGVEAKYKLTRGLLEVLLKYQFPVSILTKSVLVKRDIDLFKQFKECSVGMSITGIEDSKTRKLLEPAASPHTKRIETLKEIHKNGISTYAFVGPILPFFTDLPKIFSQLNGVVDEIMLESLNTKQSYWKGVELVLRNHYSDLLPKYKKIFFTMEKKDYIRKLRDEIKELGKKYKIKTRFFVH